MCIIKHNYILDGMFTGMTHLKIINK